MTRREVSWLEGFESSAVSLTHPFVRSHFLRLGPSLDRDTIAPLVSDPLISHWGAGRLAGFLSAWGR